MDILTLDAKGLLDLLGLLDGLLVAVVPDGDVGTGLSEGVGNGETDSSSGAGDDGGASLEGEEREDTVGVLGCLGVVVGELTRDDSLSCHSEGCGGWK